MLGLITGFHADFVQAGDETAVWYSPILPDSAHTLWLPASEKAHNFLQNKNIFDSSIAHESNLEGLPGLNIFPVDTEKEVGSAGDIVASTFFFLSLHEEWSCDERDQFGRFEANNSLLGKLGLLHRPVVAEYATILRSLLVSANCSLEDSPRFPGSTSAICMSHDIDYISKRTPGLMYREFIKNFLLNDRSVDLGPRIQRLKEYLGYCFNSSTDPYKVSALKMKAIEDKADIKATWFFKSGGTDKRDVSYSLGNAFVKRMIVDLQKDGHEIGIHPSFNAFIDGEMLSTEKRELAVLAPEIRTCRQHYLRFSYSRTWQVQAENGIHIDSTLGFAETEGFRNGSCHPFLPYDLDTDTVLPIWEIPLIVMDGTLAYYRGISADKAMDVITPLVDAVNKYCGMASILFHNTSFDAHEFPGWSKVFEETVSKLKKDNIFGEGMHTGLKAWLGGRDPHTLASELCKPEKSTGSK
jgi:uncharacterized protein DUF7033